MISNHSDRFWIEFLRLRGSQFYDKIATDSCTWINVKTMVNDLVFHIVFGTTYPICTGFVKTKQSDEINVCFVHHIERKWLRHNLIQFIAVMPFSIRDMKVGWNASAKVQQGMHLYCSFAVFPQSPGSKNYACRDGRGIQSIEYILYRYLCNLCT